MIMYLTYPFEIAISQQYQTLTIIEFVVQLSI